MAHKQGFIPGNYVFAKVSRQIFLSHSHAYTHTHTLFLKPLPIDFIPTRSRREETQPFHRTTVRLEGKRSEEKKKTSSIDLICDSQI